MNFSKSVIQIAVIAYMQDINGLVMAKDYPNGLPFEEYSKLGDKFGRMSLDEMIKDRAKNTITSFEHILMDHYIFEEPTPDFNWSLSDETEEICKYNCKKRPHHSEGATGLLGIPKKYPLQRGLGNSVAYPD